MLHCVPKYLKAMKYSYEWQKVQRRELSCRNSCLFCFKAFHLIFCRICQLQPNAAMYNFENTHIFIRYLVYVVTVLGEFALWDVFINEIMVLIFLLLYNTNYVSTLFVILISESLWAEQSNSRMV